MVRTLIKTVALAAPLTLLLAAPVLANGHGGKGGDGTSRMLTALDIGGPSWGGAYGYPSTVPFTRAFDAPAPPTAYAAPSGTVMPITVSPNTITPVHECRDFNGNAMLNASGTAFYGRACLEADGQWHSVQ